MVEFLVGALKPHGNVNYLFFLVLVFYPLDQFEISIHDTMMHYICNFLLIQITTEFNTITNIS